MRTTTLTDTAPCPSELRELITAQEGRPPSEILSVDRVSLQYINRIKYANPAQTPHIYFVTHSRESYRAILNSQTLSWELLSLPEGSPNHFKIIIPLDSVFEVGKPAVVNEDVVSGKIRRLMLVKPAHVASSEPVPVYPGYEELGIQDLKHPRFY